MSPIELGPFRITSSVAGGAFGRVWKGQHNSSGADVAVKVLRSGLDPRAHRRFAREVGVMARLDHPAIVPILDAGTVPADVAEALDVPPATPWLCTPWVEGGTLAQALPVSWATTRRWLVSVLQALAHAHARGVLHLDVKPANVLLPSGGAPRLTDFGIAHLLDEQSETGIAGSPAFMAPEQILGEGIGPWTDLYGVACLAWCLLDGRPPFHGADGATVARLQLTQPVLPPRSWPEPVRSWVLRCLVKHPSERFRHAADALEGLPDVTGAPAMPQVASGVPDATMDVDGDETWATSSFPAVLPPADAPPEPLREPLHRGAQLPEALPWSVENVLSRAASQLNLPNTGHGLLRTRAMPDVGRGDERARLWALARSVQAEASPRVVALQGPSGVGVSHLAWWLGWTTAEHGAARCLTHLPHRPVERLTVCILDVSDAEGVHAALAAASAMAQPLLIVLAVDAEHRTEMASALGAVERSPVGERLELGPIDASSMRLLAEAVLGVDQHVGVTFIRRAEGLPGRLLTDLRDALERGELVTAVGGLLLADERTILADDALAELDEHPDAPPLWRAERWLAAGQPERALETVWPVCCRPALRGVPLTRSLQLALGALEGSPTAHPLELPLRAMRGSHLWSRGRRERAAADRAWLDAFLERNATARARAWWALLAARQAPGLDAAQQILDAGIDAAEDADESSALGRLLERRIALPGGEADHDLDRALAAFRHLPFRGEWELVLRTTEAMRLIRLGRAEEAMVVTAPIQGATSARQPGHGMVLGVRAAVLVEVGALQEARVALTQAAAILDRQGDFGALGARLGLATVDLLEGSPDVVGLQRLMLRIQEVFAGPSIHGLEAAAGVVRALAIGGDVPGAVRALRAVEAQSGPPLTPWARRHLEAATDLLPERDARRVGEVLRRLNGS